MSDAEQSDIMQIGLTNLARWSSVLGVLVVAGHIVAFLLIEQWQLLALAGVGAVVVVLWSFVPRIASSDFELGVWSYGAGICAIALALGLLVYSPAVAALLALAVLAIVLLLGRHALAPASVMALLLLGAVAVMDSIVPWGRTDYDGALPVVQGITDATLLVALGAFAAHASTRMHSVAGEILALQEKAADLARRIERQSADRERGLRAATDIARFAAAAEDDTQLLEPAANMLRDRYELANVLVYLPGADGGYADLRLMVGRALVVRTAAMGTVAIGSESPVGQALARTEAVAAARPTTAGSEGYAELAAPMVVGGELLGALLLQCDRRDSFSEDEMGALAAIADQLALALVHVRRHAEATVRGAMARRPQMAAPTRTVQVGEKSLAKAMASVEPPQDKPIAQDNLLVAPIAVHGEVVGTLGFREEESRRLSPDELALVQAVADQVAQAVENLNLLQDTERTALREQLVNDITSQLQRSTSVDEVLQTAARALQRALQGYEVSIRLSPEALGMARPLAAHSVAAPSPMGDNEGEGER